MSTDQDRAVCKTVEKIALDFGETYDLSFANGGEQNNNTIPERPICDQMGINLVDGLGDKIQSSSWLLFFFLVKLDFTFNYTRYLIKSIMSKKSR